MKRVEPGAANDGGSEVPLEPPARSRMRRRLGSRLVIGGLGGAAVGAVLGAVVGVVVFDRDGAVWTAALAGVVFGFAVGMLVLGYSSLESPDPGAEPSDTDRPIADRPENVREEGSPPDRT